MAKRASHLLLHSVEPTVNKSVDKILEYVLQPINILKRTNQRVSRVLFRAISEVLCVSPTLYNITEFNF